MRARLLAAERVWRCGCVRRRLLLSATRAEFATTVQQERAERCDAVAGELAALKDEASGAIEPLADSPARERVGSKTFRRLGPGLEDLSVY